MEHKNSNYEKLVRKATRGLIGSSLTDSELQALAIGLITNNDLPSALANGIMSFVETDHKTWPDQNDAEASNYPQALISEIKRKRLSKATFANAALEFSPNLAKKLKPDSMTMDEMVKLFYKETSTEKQIALKDFISNGNSQDPYLFKILSKRR